MALATLTIDLVAKLGNIEQDLGRLNHLVDQTAGRMSSSFSSAKRAAEGLVGVLGAGALVGFVKSSIDAMGALYDLSLATGASVESLSAMKLAAKLSGTTLDEVGGSIKKLAISLGDARLKGGAKAQLFEALGIDPTTVKDTGQALFDLSKKLVAMPDQVKAISIARDLLGKNVSMAFIHELAQQEELIAKVASAQAKAAKKFQDDLILLQGGAGTLGVALANSVLPTMNEILKFSLEVKKEWGLIAAILVGIGGGSVLKALGIELDPAKRSMQDTADAFKKLAEARADLEKAQSATRLKDNDYIPGLADFRASRVEAAQKRVDAAKKELDDAFARQRKEVAAAARESEARNRKPAPFDIADLKLGDMGDKESAALESLRQKLIGASEKFSELDQVTDKVTNGSWKKFSAATKGQLLVLAEQIDAMKKDIEIRKDREKVMGKMIEQDAKVAEQLEASRVALNEWLDGLVFEATLVGKTAAERERAQALRQIDLQLARDLLAVEKELANRVTEDGMNPDLEAAQNDRRALAARQRAALQDKQGSDISRSQDWTAGASDALHKYQEDVANVAASTEAMVTRAFRGMEDSLVDFAMKGKLDFKSLADSIVADLLRIQIQQSVTKPLAAAIENSGGLGNMVKNLFGFSGGGIMTSAGPLPLRAYAGGGVATSPQLAMFGEGSTPEAYVPVPNGRIPVDLRGSGGVTIQQHIYPSPGVSSGDLMQAMVAAKNAAVAEIRNSQRRGGVFA